MLALQGVQKIESLLHALKCFGINFKTRLITDYAPFQLFELNRRSFMGAQKFTCRWIMAIELPQLAGDLSQLT